MIYKELLKDRSFFNKANSKRLIIYMNKDLLNDI